MRGFMSAPAPFEHERLFVLRQPVPPPVTPPPAPAQPDVLAPEGAPAPAPARGESSENLLAPSSEREKSNPVQFAAAELPASVPGPVLSKPSEPQLKPGPISVFIST